MSRARRATWNGTALALALVTFGPGAASASGGGTGLGGGGGVPPPRLQGTFLLAGAVTMARDIPGESVGQETLRLWRFSAPCRAGSCSTAGLARHRATATDRLTLRRVQADYYTGSGKFYAQAVCGTRIYPKGILVPFTIAVRITATRRSAAGVLMATRVRATYTNTSRRNLTPCVAALGHDAARYHGYVVSVP